jgi:hypothetical protein
VEYGIERNSLKQNDRYYDEILMALDLGSPPGKDRDLAPAADSQAISRHSLEPPPPPLLPPIG